MKTELTLQNKARFLQTIAGSGIVMTCTARSFQLADMILNGVLLNDKQEHTLYLTNSGGYSDFYAIEEWVTNLKPLSLITDEDAIELAYIHYGNQRGAVIGGDEDRYIENVKKYVINPINVAIPNVVDYLRSKGYALPWMGLSVEEMIEAGWIKLKISSEVIKNKEI